MRRAANGLGVLPAAFGVAMTRTSDEARPTRAEVPAPAGHDYLGTPFFLFEALDAIISPLAPQLQLLVRGAFGCTIFFALWVFMAAFTVSCRNTCKGCLCGEKHRSAPLPTTEEEEQPFNIRAGPSDLEC